MSFQNVRHIKHTERWHRCEWCKGDIPEGNPATRVTGIWEGALGSFYCHPACDAAWLRDPCNAEGEGCCYAHRQRMTCWETEDAVRTAEAPDAPGAGG